jgi:hypothetical protein
MVQLGNHLSIGEQGKVRARRRIPLPIAFRNLHSAVGRLPICQQIADIMNVFGVKGRFRGLRAVPP